jgi:deaminated glutathione amidase
MLRIALIQLCSGIDAQANAVQVEAYALEAAQAGAQLILTPEMTGLLDRDAARLRLNAQHAGHAPSLFALQRVAKAKSVWILLGSLPIPLAGVQDGAPAFVNRSFFIDNQGEIVAHYDKIHRFDVDLSATERYRESATYAAGDRAVVVPTPWGKLGLSICYDVRFAALYRALAQAGASMIAVPSAFTVPTGQAHWHVLLRARAIETGSYIFAPAQCGMHADGRQTYGHSLVVSPWGEVLADAGTRLGPHLVDIALEAVQTARTRIPALNHDQHFMCSD